ncbi:AMP-binding protein [Williamsia sp. R60]
MTTTAPSQTPPDGATTSDQSSVWGVGPTDTVVEILQRACRDHGGQTFLDFSGADFTYDDVWRASLVRAAGLRELGVGPGQTVVCMLDNNLDAITMWFAANALGAIWVPVNTALKADFLRHQVADAGAAVVVSEQDYAERFNQIVSDLPDLKHLVIRGTPVATIAPGTVTQHTLDEIDDHGSLDTPVDVQPSDLSMLIYTSGTTGPSKGCMISHNYATNLARTTAKTRNPDHTLWTPLPLFHLNAAATSVLATAYNKSKLAIAPRFSLSRFWPEIERTGAQRVSILGIMITLIAAMDDTPEMLRCKGQIDHVGGAPWTPELIDIWTNRFGVRAAGSSVFGLTEATFITSTPAGVVAPLGSSGRRNDDFDVRIVDDHDRELPDGQPGEIILRPRRPHIMFDGYWRRPEASMAVMHNLWFHTGDIARFDEDGWFWFVDRKKDYLRRRGENISSFELERTFRNHPDVAEVAVHAVPSNYTEDDVKVTATLTGSATVTEEELCAWSLDKLPYYAVPRYVEFRTELPKNATGKVLKYQLRDEGVTTSTWDVEKSTLVISKR